MRKKILLIAAVTLVPALAIGAPLRFFEIRSSGQFVFDIMVDSTMGMSNGLRDAYDGCYMLRVGGNELRPGGGAILWRGRGFQSPRKQMGNIAVSRQVYVPEKGGDWARYYDLYANNTKSKQTVDIEIWGNLGSDSSTKILTTSDSDSIIETTDSWFTTDDYSDGSGDPSLGHVFRRAKGKTRPQNVTLNRDDISIRYQLKLGPRKRAAIVFFAVQTKNGAEAEKLSKELAKFGKAAREKLSKADIRLIVN